MPPASLLLWAKNLAMILLAALHRALQALYGASSWSLPRSFLKVQPLHTDTTHPARHTLGAGADGASTLLSSQAAPVVQLAHARPAPVATTLGAPLHAATQPLAAAEAGGAANCDGALFPAMNKPTTAGDTHVNPATKLVDSVADDVDTSIMEAFFASLAPQLVAHFAAATANATVASLSALEAVDEAVAATSPAATGDRLGWMLLVEYFLVQYVIGLCVRMFMMFDGGDPAVAEVASPAAPSNDGFSLCARSLALRLQTPPDWSFSTNLSSAAASSSAILDAYSVASVTIFVPLLSSGNFTSGKGFSLGFLSLFDTPGSPAIRIFLTVCLGSSRNQLYGDQPFAVPVWNLNSNRPMKQLGNGFVSVSVNSNRELLLKDGDGSLVWNVSNVDAIDMQDDGNFVIFTPDNGVAWQSFDHPGDTLLQGQSLTLGRRLVSNNSVYSALMEPGGLLFYMNSPSSVPLEYDIASANKSVSEFMSTQEPFLLSKSPSVNMTASLETPACPREADNNTEPLAYAKLEDENLRVQGICSDMNYSFGFVDFIRLDNDGNLRDYRCPSPADTESLTSNAFIFVDPADPSQGCKRGTPLQCGQDASSSQYMVEMNSTAIISMPYLFETTWVNNTFPLQECLSNCASTCSCTGVFYHQNSSFCLAFGDGTPLSVDFSFLSVPFPQYSAYIKMQMPPASSSSFHIKQILPPVVIGFFLVTLVGAFVVAKKCQCCRFKKSPDLDTEEEEELQSALPMLPTRFSFDDLKRFTNGFSKLVGAGGFGSVYEGLLPDGRKGAVKKLEHVSQGKKQFLTEVATIGGISHFNIVRLYGFCSQGSNRLLVYEFMENGSLDRWIFAKEESPDNLLDWDTRFQVALGTARGLAYLHEESPEPILHLDIKPQNILLDEDFIPKLGDFGLSKLVERGTAASSSSVTATIRGTPGYIAPEWASQSMVSKKCDVYSLGMVLLELVGGRKIIDVSLMGSEEYYFPTWVASKWKEGRTLELIDKRLQGGRFNEKEVQRVVEVALLCIQQDPSLRPSIRIVCQLLEGSMEAVDMIDSAKINLEVSPPISVSNSMQSSLYHSNIIEGR
ncbi:hypothetical protein L7F22_020541 [Adiantum nelumboides]|nr:hypothetical protein [Adiantum nelumboides]